MSAALYRVRHLTRHHEWLVSDAHALGLCRWGTEAEATSYDLDEAKAKAYGRQGAIMLPDGRPLVMLPSLHLNGSGYTNLAQSYSETCAAIRTALGALNKVEPHGRDYPGDSNYSSQEDYAYAREQHADRRNRLRSILVELCTIEEQLSIQDSLRRT